MPLPASNNDHIVGQTFERTLYGTDFTADAAGSYAFYYQFVSESELLGEGSFYLSSFSTVDTSYFGYTRTSGDDTINRTLNDPGFSQIVYVINGIGGNDTIVGAQADNLIIGGAGDDSLTGNDGDDVFFYQGQANGTDTVMAGGGIDTILGSSGSDTFAFTQLSAALNGIDIIDGGTGGTDILSGHATSNSNIDLSGILVRNLDRVRFGTGDDSFTGTDGADDVEGGAGDDALNGGGGEDTARFSGDFLDYTVTKVNATTYTVTDNDPTDGDDGTDTLVDFEKLQFDDMLVSLDALPVAPVARDDALTVNEDGSGRIELRSNDSDANNDVLTIRVFTQPSNGTVVKNPDGTFTYTPDAGFNGSDSFTYTLTDGLFTDTATVAVTVTPVNDDPEGTITINGTRALHRKLTVDTSKLADPDGLGPLSYQWFADGVAIAGANAATFRTGVDQVAKVLSVQIRYTDGDGTLETVTASAGSIRSGVIVGTNQADTLKGTALNDRIVSKEGDDRANGLEGNDFLTGGGGRDVLVGGTGKDRLGGGAGGDTLHGNSGDDLLRGRGGFDTLFGGTGNDRVNGGTGNDRLTGGKGADTFFFQKGSGSDVITDFEAGTDLIKIGRGAGRFGQLKFTEEADHTLVEFSDVRIKVMGVTLDMLNDSDNFLV